MITYIAGNLMLMKLMKTVGHRVR